MHKYSILSIQQCETLLYTLNLGSFLLGFAIYPVAYGVGFTLLGLPIVKWISNFKQQPIVGGQYFNVPNPMESLGRRIVKLSPEIWVVHGERPTQ